LPPCGSRSAAGNQRLTNVHTKEDEVTKAIRFHKAGGPEVLVWEDVEVGSPGQGQIRIKQHAVGLNYLDVYNRSGLYTLQLPAVCGNEGAGVVEAIGPGVSEVKVGDRVAYASPPIGSYAEARLYPADRVVKVPEKISFETAAAMMLKGMTVQYLIKRTFKVQPGMTVLWHAAAGGVGLIACQWLKALGVKVIGTVGSDEKAALAKAHGAEHTIVYTRENFVERVKEITGGKGVPVVYDSVGKLTFAGSLDCLQPFGMMVSFGNSSGAVDPIQPTILAGKGSLYLTRPTLNTYIAKREDLVACAADLFEAVGSGTVKIEIEQRYPLKDAAQAHRDLEARKTTGSTILLP
jgi:NADPH2:quinone reductase